jgi:hypothetical protein
MSEQDLADMAANARKLLAWAGVFLAAMLVILVIDLQLKRSVARQAVSASELLSRAAALARGTIGRETLAADSDNAGDGGGDRGDHVDGSTGVAAGSDPPRDTAAGVPAAAPGGPRKRPPGNGRRTSRTPE